MSAIPANELTAAIDKAWRRVCQALDQGRAIESLRWLRLHAMLGDLVPAEPVPPSSETMPTSTTTPSEREKGESVFTDSHRRRPAQVEVFDPRRVHATGPPPAVPESRP